MEKLIRSNGNYKSLLCYKKANTIFLLTYYFCEHYLSKGDRTIDQMVQAARTLRQTEYRGRVRGCSYLG